MENPPQPGQTRTPETNVNDLVIRPATAADAKALHELVASHVEEGHLLPRKLAELRLHAGRFLVGESQGRLVACAELAPLSSNVAEIRSLVVSKAFRGRGLAAQLVSGLRTFAQAYGFDRLTAFTHDPRFFLRHGFQPVQHQMVPEKVEKDCRTCPLFGHCDQYAMVMPLQAAKARLRARSRAAVAIPV